MIRNLVLFLSLSVLIACGNADDLDEAPVELGNFSLGHNVVVAPNLTKGPVSREASKEEWTDAMTDAIEARFGRYEGDKVYHFGVSVEGYVLAQRGIPLVASPKSILIFNLTVWDDAADKKLNEEVKQITVIESFGGDTLVGSGYTKTGEEQMQQLARIAAKEIERYLVRQNYEQGWFRD
ncbi:hypothetical protein [Aquicoccus sp.]|uniref:hypothetical protein n=1 Tax=Aquicoccus sp. TaxID=2055851 RepID=UPI0035622A27